MPVEFQPVGVLPRAACPCGHRHTARESDLRSHEAQHQRWSLGVRVPKSLPWAAADIAVVTTQSSATWRQLVEDIARAPQRENHYDFSSWAAGERPEPSPTGRRAYLLRFGAYAIGYLVAADLESHRHWDFETKGVNQTLDTTRRPSIDLIWVAASHRRQGLGRALVEHLAAGSGCDVVDVSWSAPLSDSGLSLARSMAPDGVWLH